MRGDEEDRYYGGDPAGAPSVEGLPECDVDRESLSDEMRRAWLLAEEALAVEPPTPPPDRSAPVLSEWSDTVLREWMERKADRAMAARQALNAAAEDSLRERIIAGALLGVVFEDVARVLVELPVPLELKSEPEVEKIYREVLMSNAKPYLANSRAAYEACAGNALNSQFLVHWGRYCAARSRDLPGAEPEAPPPSDTTEVTVIRE